MGEALPELFEVGIASLGGTPRPPSRDDGGLDRVANSIRNLAGRDAVELLAHPNTNGHGWTMPTFDAFVAYRSDPDKGERGDVTIRRCSLREFIPGV